MTARAAGHGGLRFAYAPGAHSDVTAGGGTSWIRQVTPEEYARAADFAEVVTP